MQEQEDSVLKSMNLKVMVLKIFRFGPEMVLVVKRLIWIKSTFMKTFQKYFRYGSELDTPGICHWDAQTPNPRNLKVAPSLPSTAPEIITELLDAE